MSNRKHWKASRGWMAVWAATFWCALPKAAHACATCFGQSDEPMARGMNMGIFTLLIVIMSVLMGIAGFFVYILRRAARLESLSQGRLPTPAPSSLGLSDGQTTH
jgi:hypothetical protein